MTPLVNTRRLCREGYLTSENAQGRKEAFRVILTSKTCFYRSRTLSNEIRFKMLTSFSFFFFQKFTLSITTGWFVRTSSYSPDITTTRMSGRLPWLKLKGTRTRGRCRTKWRRVYNFKCGAWACAWNHNLVVYFLFSAHHDTQVVHPLHSTKFIRNIPVYRQLLQLLDFQPYSYLSKPFWRNGKLPAFANVQTRWIYDANIHSNVIFAHQAYVLVQTTWYCLLHSQVILRNLVCPVQNSGA